MNIDEILERHSIRGSSDTFYAKQAIKEIVEGVLQMAAEDAETCYIEDRLGTLTPIIDKQSILNVINKINF